MQLCRTIVLKYINEIFDVNYKIENYDNKAKHKYKVKERSYEKTKKYIITGLEKYNI